MILDKEDIDGLFVLNAPTYDELLADLERVVKERNELREASQAFIDAMNTMQTADMFYDLWYNLPQALLDASTQTRKAIVTIQDNLV